MKDITLMDSIKNSLVDLRKIRNNINCVNEEVLSVKAKLDGYKKQETALLDYIKSQLELHPSGKVKDDITKFTASLVKKTIKKVDEKRLKDNYHSTFIEYSHVVRKLDLTRFKKELPNHAVIETTEKKSLQIRDNLKESRK